MTERLYIGTPEDCNAVRSALDIAMGMPIPGRNQQGVQIVDEPTRLAMVAQWWSMPVAERDAAIANPAPPWIGWSLQWSTLDTEPSPGTRHACWIPADMTAVIQQASAAGRTLTIEQLTALNAAALSAIDNYPENWVLPPF